MGEQDDGETQGQDGWAADFKKLNADLLGLSIDSTYSHIAWLRTIKEKIEYLGMKNVDVAFPVISDLTMEISRQFGMVQPAASNTQAVRAVFIIDPRTTVWAILYYPLTNGRNIDEILRLLTHDLETPHRESVHDRRLRRINGELGHRYTVVSATKASRTGPSSASRTSAPNVSI